MFSIINDSEAGRVVPCVKGCKQGEVHDGFEELKGQYGDIWKTLVKAGIFPRGQQTTKQRS